ncbi:MAG: peptidase domain-containing ABC transporter [Alphaproteobacteria bacterium]
MSLRLATASAAAEQVETLVDTLRRGNPEGGGVLSPFAQCLVPLLAAIGWRGDGRMLVEALPHFATDLNLADLRNVLTRLGYMSTPVRTRLSSIDPRLLPLLFVPERGKPIVVGNAGKRPYVYDPDSDAWTDLAREPGRGTAYVVKPIEAMPGAARQAPESWFRDTMRRFKPHLLQALGLTFCINLVALLTPLVIMMIYDKVIGSHAPELLVHIVAGIGLAIGLEIAMRALRARLQAHIAARASYLIGAAAFEKVLMLPVGMSEQAPVGAQLSRLKEFQSLREFFTSNLLTLFLDLPFTLVFVLAIAAIAGPLAIIPLVLLAILSLVGVLLFPAVKRRAATSSAARAERTVFITEMMSAMRAIKELGAEQRWLDRFREISAHAALSNRDSARISQILQTVSQTAMFGAGVATLGFGVTAVMAGDMSVGALIATMTLIWRILSPVQMGFLMLHRIQQFRNAAGQLDQLMRFHSEQRRSVVSRDRLVFQGRVACHRLIHRYRPDQDPALSGIGFKIEPGQLVAIAGAMGSGKSTVLKLILGLYAPTSGVVEIDGVDTRQLDPIQLRQMIGYVPQRPVAFYGTLAQNLRLTNPAATDAELEEACAKAAILDDVRALPHGFETRIGNDSSHLSAGFHQRLALARAYVRNPSIILMDEAASSLDNAGDAALMDALQRVRGTCTVIYVTHRPSHMRMADRLIVLERGFLALDGPPDLVMPKVLGRKAA